MRKSLKLGKGVEVDLSSRSRRLYHDDPALWPWILAVLLLLLGGGAGYWFVVEREPAGATVITYDQPAPEPARPTAPQPEPAAVSEPEPVSRLEPGPDSGLEPGSDPGLEPGSEQQQPATRSEPLSDPEPPVEEARRASVERAQAPLESGESIAPADVLEDVQPLTEDTALPEGALETVETPPSSAPAQGSPDAAREAAEMPAREAPDENAAVEQRPDAAPIAPAVKPAAEEREAVAPQESGPKPRNEGEEPSAPRPAERPARVAPEPAARPEPEPEPKPRSAQARQEAAMDPTETLLLRELWINDQLTQADRAYQNGDFAGAVRSLRRIVQRYPESSDAQSASQMIEQINETAEGLIR